MPAARVRRRLHEATTDGRLVRVSRHQGWDRLDGSIVGSSSKWLVLAVEDDAGFDGHALLRVSDVRSVRRSPSSTFVERALDLEGHWPLPRLDDIDLTSTRSALASLAAAASLLALYDEQRHPHECLVGVPRRFGPKKFRFHNVTPDARWDEEDSVQRYRSVSRIDVGNAYERRLSTVAGPPPNV